MAHCDLIPADLGLFHLHLPSSYDYVEYCSPDAKVNLTAGLAGRSVKFVRFKRLLIICAALYLVAQIFFLINIQFPRGHNFDEFHYVPSAKQFLEMKENQNWEHPPLGKLIMAAGIGLWGDIPIGWRFMSTVFGALTLVGMYLWGLALFGTESAALWVALITLLNQLLYVQARIGMLDTFMFGFIVWGLAAFTATWKIGLDPKRSRQFLMATGIFLGLGTACKWFTVIPWFTCLVLIGLVRLFQAWRTRFEAPSPDDWYHPDLWKGLRYRDFFLYLGVIPLLVYFATFTPYYIIQKPAVGFWDLFAMQAKMYDGQLRVVSQHPYMSQWPDWPLLKRPIWYAFDKEGANQEIVRGVLLIGNPLIMWSGMIALVACAWGFIRSRRRDAFLILAFYAAFFGSWILIPRKVAFYYYYYPAGMVLSFALAYVFQWWDRTKRNRKKVVVTKSLFPDWNWPEWAFLAASLGVFVYFFPILAALKISSDDFIKWMWFRSWI
jgi:dolichyl-phosphate-mannose-protein mannosyltransferase